MTASTVRKWLGRYLTGRRSRADRCIFAASPLATCYRAGGGLAGPGVALAALATASDCSTGERVRFNLQSCVFRRAGLPCLSDLPPREPIQRYEHAAPGDLLHIETKKLGCITRPGHRVTGNRRDTMAGAGWEYLFVAGDDHVRIASRRCTQT
ncbi:Transposase (plasmid) [Mycetohabitans rhizoxinica HKI 454]|uniref:Transposase n=1 Tax=Mycetohabitans rhizoxinica (strain DSM 19002 / CIP 109453 / HKI 454) TaxID=882378 RepID=E5AW76_MYCRK|nr:Transposase [Mycetohabitans rhizoxinica HKI 454]